MMRFSKMSALVLATMVLCSGMSLAASKGGSSSRGSGGSSSRGSSGISRGGSNYMVLRGTSTKTVSTKIVTTKIVTTRIITTQVVNTRVTRVNPGKTTNVVPGICTFVIPTIVTHCPNPQVICGICCPVPIFGGFFGTMFGDYLPVQYERYLRLQNETSEKITVYLRYHTQDVTGKWDWIPEAPESTSNQWLAFELQPGQILDPVFMNLPIAANRIRLYAVSPTRSWTNFKDEDFWLVPEVTPEGEHLYYSDYRQTYPFSIKSN